MPCQESTPPLLPTSAPPTSLDECFFFNSLVVMFNFLSVLVVFVFKVVVLLLVVRGGKVYRPMPPSWPEVHNKIIFMYGMVI